MDNRAARFNLEIAKTVPEVGLCTGPCFIKT